MSSRRPRAIIPWTQPVAHLPPPQLATQVRPEPAVRMTEVRIMTARHRRLNKWVTKDLGCATTRSEGTVWHRLRKVRVNRGTWLEVGSSPEQIDFAR